MPCGSSWRNAGRTDACFGNESAFCLWNAGVPDDAVKAWGSGGERRGVREGESAFRGSRGWRHRGPSAEIGGTLQSIVKATARGLSDRDAARSDRARWRTCLLGEDTAAEEFLGKSPSLFASLRSDDSGRIVVLCGMDPAPAAGLTGEVGSIIPSSPLDGGGLGGATFEDEISIGIGDEGAETSWDVGIASDGGEDFRRAA